MRKDHDEQNFYHLYGMVHDFTMLSTDRLRGLYDAVMSAIEAGIPGDIVECGTARGGSAALMCLILKELGAERSLWVCDTFEGIPPATDDDPAEALQYTGQFRGDIEDVLSLFSQFGILQNAQLVKGLFQDTLPSLGVEKIAVLHLDGDWYESTRCGLENLYDRVVPGGVIQIDDYGHWAGCQKAVKEFFFKREFMPDLTFLDYTGVQFKKEGGE
jgi:hypothetical protein